jgi:hypothetical protein
MKKILENVAGLFIGIGILVLIGSIVGFIIGPDQLTAMYERARPVLPYFLAGLGLVVLGALGSSLFSQPREAPPSPSDEQVRDELAKNLASLHGVTAGDIEKTLTVIMAADRDRLNAAQSVVHDLANAKAETDVILATVRSLCSCSRRPPGGPARSEGRCEADPPASTPVSDAEREA